MVVWGGVFYDGSVYWFDTGGQYDPAMDSWTPTSQALAPSARYGARAVWTGSLMVVFGGTGYNFLSEGTGGRYDPATDSWMSMSDENAPLRRAASTMVWTGDSAIVWGGLGPAGYLSSGGSYTP
jgi:N-acetylneuraminic acid mutarotase